MDKIGLKYPSNLFNSPNHSTKGDGESLLCNGLAGGHCPSPLDRIRCGQTDRRSQFGLSPVLGDSFEANQSFPKCSKVKLNIPSRKMKLDNFKGGELNDVSFTGSFPQRVHGSRDGSRLHYSSSGSSNVSSRDASINCSSHEKSLSESWAFYNYIGSGSPHTAGQFPSIVRNPNKAVCTVNAKTSQILTANEMTCELLCCDEEELIGKPLKDYLRLKPKDQTTILESHLEPSGEVININGKVVEVVDSTGLVLPVSLWVKRLEQTREPRCLVVMEPVERTVAIVHFDAMGKVVSCDDQLVYLHGYEDKAEVIGRHVKELIPALRLPALGRPLTKEIRKQSATGRTKDGASFPLSVAVEMLEDYDSSIGENEDPLASDEDIVDDDKLNGADDDNDVCGGVDDNYHVSDGAADDDANEDVIKDDNETQDYIEGIHNVIQSPRKSRPKKTRPTSTAATNERLDIHDCSGVSGCSTVFKGVVWVFANISGLITILPDGTVHNINDNFSLMMFGYRSKEVVEKDVGLLIPDFYEILELDEGSDDSGAHVVSCAHYGHGSGQRDNGCYSREGTPELRQVRLDFCNVLDEFSPSGPGVTSTPNKSWPLANGSVNRLSVDGSNKRPGKIVANNDDMGKTEPNTSLRTSGDGAEVDDDIATGISHLAIIDKANKTDEIAKKTNDSRFAISAKANNTDEINKKSDDLGDKMALTNGDKDAKGTKTESSDFIEVEIDQKSVNDGSEKADFEQDESDKLVTDKSPEIKEKMKDELKEGSDDSGVPVSKEGLVKSDEKDMNKLDTVTPNRDTSKVKTPLKSVVCTLNCSTGKFDIVPANFNDPVEMNEIIDRKGCSTPVQKYFGHLNELDVPSPCLSDIVVDADDDNEGIDEVDGCWGDFEKLAVKENIEQGTDDIVEVKLDSERKANSINENTNELDDERDTDSDKVTEAKHREDSESDKSDRVKTRKSLVYCDINTENSARSENAEQLVDSNAGDGDCIDDAKEVNETSDSNKSNVAGKTKDGKNKTEEIGKKGTGVDFKKVKRESGEMPDIVKDIVDPMKNNTSANAKSDIVDMLDVDILDDSKVEKIGTNDQNQNNQSAESSLKDHKSCTSENRSSSFSDIQNSGFLLKSSEASEMSSVDESEELDEIDESLLHRSSIQLFLSSRLNKSRNLDNSGSFTNSFMNGSGTGPGNSRAGSKNSIRTPDIEVFEPNLPLSELPETPYNDITANLDNSRLSDFDSPSLASFEQHEKDFKQMMKYRTGSKYSDYSSNGPVAFPEGSFQGQGLHKDQTLLGIVFQIKRIVLDDGMEVYCMWISRDPEEVAELARSYANLTLASSLNSTADHSFNFSFGEVLAKKACSESKELLEDSVASHDLSHNLQRSHDLSLNTSNRSHKFAYRSHDHSARSHDNSHRSHDFSHRSHDHSARSHDNSHRSHDYSSKSHDHSARSHDNSHKSHDYSHRSHDYSSRSHDISRKSVESVQSLNQSSTRSPRVRDTQGTHETEEDKAVNHGPYNTFYNTLQTIGKGAFGFVKMAERKVDKQQVVVKFIRRGKVFNDCWVEDETYGRIPLEVSVLYKLKHPNIVTVLDVFENRDYIQLVMEKHGSGMDLFEFIDRSPNMDEPLASYIFRQMVAAVSYLHSKNILHRDIKDENVIVNEQFQIKLIDFGAVAFMEQGKLFSTFCGTMEYCSPEVLMGNKYHGPELEVWSLGVTLYTLVFGENPFFDVEETIKCTLKPPFPVSSQLMVLLCWMLHPDPKRRATVSGIENNCWVQQHINIAQYAWNEVLPNYEFHGNTASDNRPDSPTEGQDLHTYDQHNGTMDDLKCNLLDQLSTV